jgi:hypothetical protein
MALVKYGPLAQEVAGTVGGVTFSRVASGKACRGWRAPTNKNTPAQLDRRGWISYYSHIWFAALDITMREEWDTYAPSCIFTNSLGENYTLNGFNMFLRNVTIQRGFTPYPEPTAPTQSGFGSTNWLALSLGHTNGQLTLEGIAPEPAANEWLLFEVHGLRRITQVHPTPSLIARYFFYTNVSLPYLIHTFPNPLPGGTGSIAALCRYFSRDVYYRLTKPIWTQIASS